MSGELKGKHICAASQFSRESIDKLIKTANDLRVYDEKKTIPQLLQSYVMTPLFFENSSRTFCSFVAAFQKLGGGVVNLNIQNSSLASKGESLEDTIRVCDASSDIIVLRHPDEFALNEAIQATKRACIINAGNGAGEHPTQALLDILTIYNEIGRLDNLNVVMLGDLRNGRTVHSLSEVLTLFTNTKFTFVSPPSLKMPQSIIEYVTKKGFETTVSDDLTTDIVSKADVIYVTRVQKERFSSLEEYEKVSLTYCVNKKIMENAKPAGKMCVMHPLPRNEELSVDVDSDPRAAYFRQMRCGLFARMALILAVLGIELP